MTPLLHQRAVCETTPYRRDLRRSDLQCQTLRHLTLRQKGHPAASAGQRRGGRRSSSSGLSNAASRSGSPCSQVGSSVASLLHSRGPIVRSAPSGPPSPFGRGDDEPWRSSRTARSRLWRVSSYGSRSSALLGFPDVRRKRGKPPSLRMWSNGGTSRQARRLRSS